jgi:hypothetical protein
LNRVICCRSSRTVTIAFFSRKRRTLSKPLQRVYDNTSTSTSTGIPYCMVPTADNDAHPTRPQVGLGFNAQQNYLYDLDGPGSLMSVQSDSLSSTTFYLCVSCCSYRGCLQLQSPYVGTYVIGRSLCSSLGIRRIRNPIVSARHLIKQGNPN